jgi:3-oxoacyl-[acyl-carrier-protein] synthase I
VGQVAAKRATEGAGGRTQLRRVTRLIGIHAQSLVCAAGLGVQAFADALRDDRSALRANDWSRVPLPTWLGRVPGVEEVLLPTALSDWDCRAIRLAWMGLQADGFMQAAQGAISRHGAARVGLVLGTSASTIGASEQAYREGAGDGGFPAHLRHAPLHTLHAVTAFVQAALGVRGPSATISTACSSSAKAFAQAQRWLQLELVDAVVVAGVDALCDSVLFGFHSLQLVSALPCAPFGAERSGISVGEAAGFVLLERGAAAVQLLGCGESNDAHHMSSPHPQGLGAERALRSALAQAQLSAQDVGYVQLHGTASARNDEVEAALLARWYGPGVHASASKGISGHTMGAAGMLGALACMVALQDGVLSGSVGTGVTDPSLGADFASRLRLRATRAHVHVAASHSFGFGGNNCVLMFGRGA